MDELATRARLGAGYQAPGTINYTQVSADLGLYLNECGRSDLTHSEPDTPFNHCTPLYLHFIDKYRIYAPTDQNFERETVGKRITT